MQPYIPKCSRLLLKNLFGVRALSYEMPQFNFPTPKYEDIDLTKVKEIRLSNLNPALVTHFREPVLIHSGKMQWLFDDKGKRYLDLFGGIVTVSVGHCHEHVVAALDKQIRKLWHTTNIYLHPKIHEYTEKLLQKLPPELQNVYFVNSGSEANDLAVMMARLYTKSNDIISLRNAYHGVSLGILPLTAHGNWKPNVLMSSGFHNATNPDTYNGFIGGYRDGPVQSLRAEESKVTNGVCSSSDHYVAQLKEVIDYSIPTKKVAGFFAESIQGVGGTVQFPLGYLKKAFQLVRDNGGICISDEVQTGFGRTGEHFWGFESHGVVPDIVTMAKGIGNGFPLAAVVTRKEIAQTMSTFAHFNTFGGNPMSSAVGIAVLEAIQMDDLQNNSNTVGTHFLLGLKDLRDRYEIVGDVRGKGLMIGIEMVQDKESRRPLDPAKFGDIWESCKNNGVLFGKGGRYGNVFRVKPPMCITIEDANFSLSVLDDALKHATGA